MKKGKFCTECFISKYKRKLDLESYHVISTSKWIHKWSIISQVTVKRSSLGSSMNTTWRCVRNETLHPQPNPAQPGTLDMGAQHSQLEQQCVPLPWWKSKAKTDLLFITPAHTVSFCRSSQEWIHIRDIHGSYPNPHFNCFSMLARVDIWRWQKFFHSFFMDFGNSIIL